MALRSIRNALLGGAILVATVAVAAPASATVTVDFGFIPLNGAITYTPDGAISGATTISGLGSITTYYVNTVGMDDTTGILDGTLPVVHWNDPITFVLGTQSIAPVTETFTTSAGSYSASFNTLFAAATSGSDSLAWVLEGTVTLPSTATQEIFLSAAFTNISSSNAASTNVSFTETSNPPPIIDTPEPASMAILGVGMLALGAARRRKR